MSMHIILLKSKNCIAQKTEMDKRMDFKTKTHVYFYALSAQLCI